MTSAEERIKELAREQALDPADAARLLDAVRPASGEAARRGWLSNPFERWSGETTSAIAAGIAAAGLATSRMGVRYDGALDLHVGPQAVPIGVALVDQLVAVVVTALVMWGAARCVSRARFVDVLGAVGFARAPLAMVAVPLALLVPLFPRDPTKPTLALLGIAVLGMIGAICQIWLLVLGFRTATGCRGGRLALSVVGGLFAAELVTKLVLVALAVH